jgi:hypothetical protein
MELEKEVMTEGVTTEGKEKKAKEPSLTNALSGVTPEIIEKLKLKDERAVRVANLLAEGNSKSEVLAIISEDEAVNGVPEGKKPISHQIIYQIYKRLKEQEGVTVVQKELKTYRKKAAEKAPEGNVEPATTSKDEFAEAEAADTGVVEG